MIVISNNLVLSAAEEISADNPVILWDSLVTATNVESTSEDEDFPIANVANPATHLKWVGGVNTGDEYITITTGTVEPIDGAGIAKHNLGSSNATISWEACEDLSLSPQVWTEVISERVLADDAPALFRWEPGIYQAVRLRIQQGDEVPEIAVVYLGPLLLLERSIKVDVPHIPFPMGIVSKEVNGKSESGNFLGRIEINRFNQSEAEFAHITPVWYRENFQPFVAARVSFFFAWNPTEYPTEVGYAWLMDNPMPEVDTVTRRVAIGLKMQGVV